jgi:hypothetical protein
MNPMIDEQWSELERSFFAAGEALETQNQQAEDLDAGPPSVRAGLAAALGRLTAALAWAGRRVRRAMEARGWESAAAHAPDPHQPSAARAAVLG